jgi:hypothetical protein
VPVKESRKFSQPQLTIGLDLGNRSIWYCVLDERGELQWERKVSTRAKAMREAFHRMARSLIALETGTHSPWVRRLLSGRLKLVAHRAASSPARLAALDESYSHAVRCGRLSEVSLSTAQKR